MTQGRMTYHRWIVGLLVLVALVGGIYSLPVRFVVLWTDALVYLLVAMIASAAVLVRRKPYLLDPWRQVLRQRLAAAALVVLCVYVAIGLLDSVHFRKQLPPQEGVSEVHYAPETMSLLDVALAPIRDRKEKTYSAPFATHLFAKETVELADGSRVREFPRLAHGGAHLADPANDRWPDILATSVMAVIEGLLVWGVLCALVIYALARRYRCAFGMMLGKVRRGEADLPWLTILVTVGIMIVLAFWAAELGVKYHILGTDKVGGDVFYQALKSIRTGLLIGTLTTLVMLPFALAMGVSAGYFRGWVDDVIQYVYTTLNSIPGVLLIAAAVLLVQSFIANNPEMFETTLERADARLLFLCLILGVTSWTGLCRLLRGEALKLRELDYVSAAQAFGVPQHQILARHVFPNVLHIVLISVVLDFSALVLAEAVLSYVGVGVDPTMHSWGNMINSARLEMAREPMVWWSLMAAFIFMFVLVLAANLFSDAVRDAFDPRLRAR